MRHGKTKSNFERRYTGRNDEPLCGGGVIELMSKRRLYPKSGYGFIKPDEAMPANGGNNLPGKEPHNHRRVERDRLPETLRAKHLTSLKMT